MPRKGFSFVSLFIFIAMILVACGGSSSPAATTAPAATTPPEATAAPAATTAPEATVSEATTAPEATAASEEATAVPSGSTEPGYSIVLPTNLRTDLKGASIKAILGSEGPGSPFDDAAAQKFSEATGIDVQVIRGDQSSTDRLATYRQQLSAGSSDVDVYMIDVIWPGIIAEFAEDLSSSFPNAKEEFFPAIVENNTFNGQLVGIPWYTDAGLLYYRKDLLEKYGYSNPPATWAELEEMSKKIQEGERATNPDFWGYVWQGKAYEGLTCDALEWQVSNGGGSIVESDGTISINNPQAIAAFEQAKGWIGTISPPGVTTYQEEEARGIWQAGNAAFMRNWPYAYATGQASDSAIKDKFDVSPLPKGEGDGARNADTLGGWQLMVNKYSKNKEAAIEFVKYLTSPELAKAYSIERSLLPTRPAVYDDADVLATNPYYAPLKAVFSGGAVARPSTVTGDLYNDVSTVYFTNVNQILTGQKDAATAVADIEREIQRILR